jgi:predicted MFS family arabinose efflux permease
VADRPATYRELFAVPAFRALFVSRSLGIAAATLRIVALSMLVFTATSSPLLSAIAFSIGFLPQVAGGLLASSLADRLRPRPLIVAGYLLECAAAVVPATGALSIGASLGVLALLAACTPVFNGASSRVVADVLTGDRYVLGRSLFNVASGAAQLLGMGFGGLAVAAVGPRYALLISAAAQLFAAAVIRLRLPDLSVPDGLAHRSVLRQSWATNRALLADRRVRRLLLVQWLPPAFVVGGEAMIVAYAGERGFTETAAGILLACAPGGMLAGDLIVARLARPSVRARLVVPLLALLGVPLMLLAAHPPLLLAAVLVGLSASGFAYQLGLQRAFLDAVPEAHRGQAFGLLTTGLMTLQGLGPIAFGLAGQLAGTTLAIAAAGAGATLCAVVWAGTSRRQPRLGHQPATIPSTRSPVQ